MNELQIDAQDGCEIVFSIPPNLLLETYVVLSITPYGCVYADATSWNFKKCIRKQEIVDFILEKSPSVIYVVDKCTENEVKMFIDDERIVRLPNNHKLKHFDTKGKARNALQWIATYRYIHDNNLYKNDKSEPTVDYVFLKDLKKYCIENELKPLRDVYPIPRGRMGKLICFSGLNSYHWIYFNEWFRLRKIENEAELDRFYQELPYNYNQPPLKKFWYSLSDKEKLFFYFTFHYPSPLNIPKIKLPRH